MGEQNGERHYEAELYRLLGSLLLQQDTPDEQGAEESFLRAVEIARGGDAKGWELRAVLSLCRLWQTQGRATEAHRRLEEIYSKFDEGFGTPDLQEARALLEGRRSP